MAVAVTVAVAVAVAIADPGDSQWNDQVHFLPRNTLIALKLAKREQQSEREEASGRVRSAEFKSSQSKSV